MYAARMYPHHIEVNIVNTLAGMYGARNYPHHVEVSMFGAQI